MLTKKELPVMAKTSRRNYLKLTQQRYSRNCDYLLPLVLKKFLWKLPEAVDSAETCWSKIIERKRKAFAGDSDVLICVTVQLKNKIFIV